MSTIQQTRVSYPFQWPHGPRFCAFNPPARTLEFSKIKGTEGRNTA